MGDGIRLGRADVLPVVTLPLIGCLSLGYFALVALRFTEGQGGVPLDDAWIHFQFARNLARGAGLSFNPGQPTSGSTAPLWTLLLAAVYLMGGRFPVAGQLASALCFLCVPVATYLLGKRLTARRWAAWLAGALVVLNGRMVWAGLSALETSLFTTLSLLAITLYLDDRSRERYRLRTAALFGLAALARPDGYLLFALSLADAAMRWVVRPARLVRLLAPVALFTLVVAPYLLFSWLTDGHLLPNTYHAKATFDWLPDFDFLSLTAKYLILDNPLLLPFYLLGLIGLLRKGAVLSMWSAGLPLAYAMLHAILYQHGRYLMPLIPCNAVIGMAGLLWALPVAQRRGWRWAASARALTILTVLLLAGTAWRLPTMADLYAWNVDNINTMHVAIARWVTEHTPQDALLGVNDIGAIGYLSERPVVDLAGLVTPEVASILRLPEREVLLAEFMAKRGVQYV
ncbi:MAG: hypothetical protein N2508_09715, partial [Anaerolineae bacterium]|nr:hypothetical protein [Anaerolineae bacterium]